MPAVTTLNVSITKCLFANSKEINSCDISLKQKKIAQSTQVEDTICDCLLKVKMMNMKGKMIALALLIFSFTYLYASKVSTQSFSTTSTTSKEVSMEKASVISPLVIPDKYMFE
jgi:hypothetical protein